MEFRGWIDRGQINPKSVKNASKVLSYAKVKLFWFFSTCHSYIETLEKGYMILKTKRNFFQSSA